MIKIIFKKQFAGFCSIQKAEDSINLVSSNDFKMLNINKDSSIKQVYLSYKKHISFYENQSQQSNEIIKKRQDIQDSYLKIMKYKVQNESLLELSEQKELEMIQNQNYGIVNAQQKTISQQLVDEIDHNAEQWTGHLQYPKILFGLWISLGLFSLTIETA